MDKSQQINILSVKIINDFFVSIGPNLSPLSYLGNCLSNAILLEPVSEEMYIVLSSILRIQPQVMMRLMPVFLNCLYQSLMVRWLLYLTSLFWKGCFQASWKLLMCCLYTKRMMTCYGISISQCPSYLCYQRSLSEICITVLYPFWKIT